MHRPSGKEIRLGVPIGPKESYDTITGNKLGSDINHLITRKCDLSTSADRFWLIEQIRDKEGLAFQAEDLVSIVKFISRVLGKEWLTIYANGQIALKTGEKMLHGFNLFNHLIPLGYGLSLLESKPGFTSLLGKLNRPTYERLSSFLEALAAARYAAAGYKVELEPETPEEKRPDFRVLFNDEWIYFECKRINVRENQSVKRNFQFINSLEDAIIKRFKEQIPEDHRIEIRLDRKPTPAEVKALLDDIERMILNGRHESWAESKYGKYALVPRFNTELPTEYSSYSMQITVGTTPIPMSLTQTPVAIFFNPFGTKIEQKFRSILRLSKKQIPSEERGILVIQGLDEKKAAGILQQRIGHPEYHNIIAGVAIRNGAIAVRRDDHTDVGLDFIGKCVSHSLFYGYDLGNV